LKNELRMDRAEATEVAHLFKMGVYFLPLAGGWLADRWLGRYWTILSLSLFYCLGHGTLAVFEGTRGGLYAGLVLIAIGAGGIKPCVSAFVGDQFGEAQRRLLPRVYGLFYWAINLGAFLAFALIPLVRDHAGYRWAFGVPGLFMGLATLIFWLGRRHYTRQPPARQTKQAGFLKVVWFAWQRRQERQAGQSFLDPALARFSPAEVRGAKAVASILMVFATIPVFWALFDQINTTWVLQGEKMAPFQVLGYKVDAERIQSISALLVLVLIPVFTIWLYPLAERLGLRPTPLRRMGAGMVLAALSFMVCAWLQGRMDAGQSLSLAWQIIPYVFLEAGEVMLSVTGLEFAFSQAPAYMKSTIMSFWLITVAVGNLLVASFTNLNHRLIKAQGAAEFLFYALLMLAVAGIFTLCARRYREPVAAE
jgi:POT family proton-dependent oligopeptide transporter